MDKYFAWFGLKGKLVLTILLSALAFIMAMLFPSPTKWLCFAAMLMSSAGDVFLMHLRIVEERIKNFFLIGAVFFMLAHLLYTACFALKISTLGVAYWNAGTWSALGIAAGCLIYFASICKNRGELPLAIMYLAIITLNCMTVFSFAWSAGSVSAVIAALGALCFLASDLVIGFGLLADIHHYDDLIWWLYPIGQVLLILGAGR